MRTQRHNLRYLETVTIVLPANHATTNLGVADRPMQVTIGKKHARLIINGHLHRIRLRDAGIHTDPHTNTHFVTVAARDHDRPRPWSRARLAEVLTRFPDVGIATSPIGAIQAPVITHARLTGSMVILHLGRPPAGAPHRGTALGSADLHRLLLAAPRVGVYASMGRDLYAVTGVALTPGTRIWLELTPSRPAGRGLLARLIRLLSR